MGVFPRQVSLEIRHTHPALGLNEVAHQRTRHSQLQDNHFIQQCHYQNLQPSQQTVSFHEYSILSNFFHDKFFIGWTSYDKHGQSLRQL